MFLLYPKRIAAHLWNFKWIHSINKKLREDNKIK